MESGTENYQLKWHSFGPYLHGCVAAAVNGDQFTDVSLVTMDGRQIQAHRFILSACSQYLHQVLKLQTRTHHIPLSIILPPEINHKTLKVLIQYMYSGETTVSQDILENVLRGGDLLKVKGLWRPKEDEHTEKSKHPEKDNSEKVNRLDNNERRPPMKLSTSNRTSNASRSNASTPANTNSACSTPIQNNSVIKEPPRNVNDRHERSSIERHDRHDKVSTPITPPPTKRPKNEESVIKTTQQTPPPLAPIQLRNKQDRHEQNDRQERLERAEKNSKDRNKDREIENAIKENEISTAKDLMSILVIKEEPIEWAEVNQEEIELVEREEIFDSEMVIKPEIQMDDAEDNPENLYTPLTCELCSETFTLPADWVKHVQTHTDMMPAKRQKRGRPSNDEDNTNFPPLQCDMCQEFFPTPAKWVQHIQFAHTEHELRQVNKSSSRQNSGSGDARQTQRSSSSQITQAKITSQHKVCAVCNKKFPSHASMIIHRRTHTGEKPYMCDYCCKGFNVKSNLLRHLRTLHDKYVSPNDIESKEGDDSDV